MYVKVWAAQYGYYIRKARKSRQQTLVQIIAAPLLLLSLCLYRRVP